MKKKILTITFFTILIITLFLIPFAIEKILLCESIFPFNIPISFSKESWFGFISSYLGAIGTISLGIIALYQNKKYKELSEKSEERFLSLQEKIKTLTEKSVELIELNSKLEEAKYFPILSDIHHTYWNLTSKHLKDEMDFEKDAFQVSYKQEDPYEISSSYMTVFDKYYTFTYTLKNDSEHMIHNFTCSRIIQNNDSLEMGIWLFQTCDIKPGAALRCVYATKYDLAQQCRDGKIQSLSFQYKMDNVLGDRFEMKIDFYFNPCSENNPPDFFAEISPIKKIETN